MVGFRDVLTLEAVSKAAEAFGAETASVLPWQTMPSYMYTSDHVVRTGMLSNMIECSLLKRGKQETASSNQAVSERGLPTKTTA